MSKQMHKKKLDAERRDIDSALRRAAQSARDRARATGTRIVVSRNGVIHYLNPDESAVAETPASYKSE